MSIEDDLNEWKELIYELSCKEIALFDCKAVYNEKSEKILAETDFKSLYGANNQKVRDNHIRNELSDEYAKIKDLEFSIDFIARRIAYLKRVVDYKIKLMEAKQ